MTGAGGQSVDESLDHQSPLASALAAGVGDISQHATVRFVKYARLVLPLDGFVFWVRTDLLGPAAIANAFVANQVVANQPPAVVSSDPVIDVAGSFHIAAKRTQQGDENYSINSVVFTTTTPIEAFNTIAPAVMYIGEFDIPGQTLRFAFSNRENFYRQAGLWHYSGDAVYVTMQTQIIDSAAAFDSFNLVVSNSLPFWLTMTGICPVFPSFLIPENQPPPYVSVHIDDTDTSALQPIPFIDIEGSHWQLAEDRVRLTFYGLRNFTAMDFVDKLLARIGADGDPVGLMAYPVVRDLKQPQVEFGTLAMKKRVDLSVSYYQNRVRDLARQFIISCIPKFIVGDT